MGNIVGTVQESEDDGDGFVLRWRVDDFLRFTQKDYRLFSPDFHFRSAPFYLWMQHSVGSEPKVHLMSSRFDPPRPPPPFSWKLSVESGDGTLLQYAEGVKTGMKHWDSDLGSLRDVEELLHPDGSLVIKLQLHSIQEETAANSSQSLEHHPGMDNGVVTVQESADDGDGYVLRWRVDDFRRFTQKDYPLTSPEFHFRSAPFYLRIQHSVGSELEVRLRSYKIYPSPPPPPFSWKLSAESTDGKVLQCAEGVNTGMKCWDSDLGSLRDIEKPDGSLVINLQLHSIPEETAANSSQSLQHRPGMNWLSSAEVGTVQVSADNGDGLGLRWTVEDFLGLEQNNHVLWSPCFHFRDATLYLKIQLHSFGSEKYEPKIRLCWQMGQPPPIPFSWKLSVEIGDGTILQCAEGVVEKSNLWDSSHELGSLRDVEGLLNPKGSLVMKVQLRRIPEETAANPSLSLQLPAGGDVKSSAPPVKNRTAADGAGKSDLSKTVEAEANVEVLAGSLQQDFPCTKNTWIVSDIRSRVEHGTFCSEKFPFGSKLWQLRLFKSPVQREGDVAGVCELLLSLKEVGGGETSRPFSWRLRTEDRGGAILQSSVGVHEDAKGAPDITLNLGPLRDAGQFLDSEGTLRAACDLRLLQETADASSQAESGVGTDALARDYENLLLSEEATDATVRVKGQRKFLVHRAVLVARTPVFASMFRHRMSESETGVVDVEDCDPDIFRRFLQFVYTGSVEDLPPEEAMELYRVADKYQVDELRSRCLECVRAGLGIETFCPTLALALQHCERELTERATEFFVDNADDIVLTVQWQEFLSKNPTQANELFAKALRKKKEVIELLSKNAIQANDKL